MGNENEVVITCPFCQGKISVPPQWWDKNTQITCKGCKNTWREVIPKQKKQTMEEEMVRDAKDFLSGSLSKDMSDFLFGLDKEKKK